MALKAMKTIEIEKRFLLNANVDLEMLTTLGAHLRKTVINHDIYYDTKQCALTSNDVWLRSRNTIWELKYPNKSLTRSMEYTSLYNETQDLFKIATVLGNVLEINIDENSDYNIGYFKKWMCDVCKLDSLCDFVTKRKSYSIKYLEREYEIDLDYTDFGYNIMEIETIAIQDNEAVHATNDLLDFCEYIFKQWNVCPIPALHTKIQMYLFTHNLSAHDLIVKAGKFPPLESILSSKL